MQPPLVKGIFQAKAATATTKLLLGGLPRMSGAWLNVYIEAYQYMLSMLNPWYRLGLDGSILGQAQIWGRLMIPFLAIQLGTGNPFAASWCIPSCRL